MFGGFNPNNSGFGFGGNWTGENGFPMTGARFSEMYRAYSMALYTGRDKQRDNYGGKVILPTSAMHKLTNYMSENPIVTLQILSQKSGKKTHAGVLEFTAEEGRMYVPHWMLQTLQVDEGELLQVSLTSVPRGKFIKIQAQSVDFLEITDPKAVLENAFRNYQYMTQADIITFEYNNKTFDIKVLEVKPQSELNAIMTVDTDIEVDFAAPLGYVDPSESDGSTSVATSKLGKTAAGATLAGFSRSMNISEHAKLEASQVSAFSAFEGSGRTVGSSTKDTAIVLPEDAADETPSSALLPSSGGLEGIQRGAPVPPALHLPFGKLYFGYPLVPLVSKDSKESVSPPKFTGKGISLRSAKKQ